MCNYSVVIIDDEPWTREVVKHLGKWKELALTIIGEASDGDLGLEMVRELRPDIILTDVRMPYLNGIDLVRTLRAELMRLHPSIPRHSRIYLANLPGGIGLITGPGDSPTLRTWYADPTLAAGFFTEYHPRPAGKDGRDYFFAADSDLSLIEFTRGAGAVSPSLARNPVWQTGENELATIFSEQGEWDAALQGFLTLASLDPGAYDYALNAAVCYGRLGDAVSAARWLRRSAALRASTRRALATGR